ncbi:MAG: hypothetical protein JRI22_09030 [Deltaproteobacteria bacterium]|nr:hypothetical protein [Deltaproteobacteria bacterium]
MAKAKKTGKRTPAKKTRTAKAATKKVAKKTAANSKAAETKKQANGKAANGKVAKQAKVTQADLEALRKPVDEAKARLDKARAEAKALTDKAQALVKEAKDNYREALAPYRDACRKAGIECKFEGGRSANVSEKVSFLVEKTDKGVRVMVKGQPSTEEVIPFSALKESINRQAYSYTEKHLGPKEEIGNKGGSLSNRLRAVLS